MDNKIYEYDFDFSDTASNGALSSDWSKSHLTINRNLSKDCIYVFENLLNVKSEIRRMMLKVMKKTIFLQLSGILHKIVLQKIAYFPTSQNKQVQEDLEDLREELFQKIKTLSCIFSKHSAQALNLCIFVFSSVFQTPLANISKVKLFHLLHWEVKGKHSTDLVFQSMQAHYLKHPSQDIQDNDENNLNVSNCKITTFKQLSAKFDRTSLKGEATKINSCYQSIDQANICIDSYREHHTIFEGLIYQSRRFNESIGYRFSFTERN